VQAYTYPKARGFNRGLCPTLFSVTDYTVSGIEKVVLYLQRQVWHSESRIIESCNGKGWKGP